MKYLVKFRFTTFNKIFAIKAIREAANLDLRTAKDFVDRACDGAVVGSSYERNVLLTAVQFGRLVAFSMMNENCVTVISLEQYKKPEYSDFSDVPEQV
jgi:hypothetical protein